MGRVFCWRGMRLSARRTIVVHTKLSGHLLRVDAARKGSNGVQVLTMGQLAARLAGGFLQPIDPERLQEAVYPLWQVRAWVSSTRSSLFPE